MTLTMVSDNEFITELEIYRFLYDPYRNKIRFIVDSKILKKIHMNYLIKDDEELTEVNYDVEKFKSVKIDGREILQKSLLKRFIFNYKRNVGVIKMYTGKATLLQRLKAPFYINKID